MKTVTIRLLIIALVLSGLTVGTYLVTRKFLHDRTSALMPTRSALRPQGISNTTTRRVYTQKEIAEARKKGTLPNEFKQQPLPINNSANDAVQRSLRTIEEINKINQMNQKLIDQQRRMQNNNR